ncbi:hypothetical protein TSUD_119100 [Trifolium subterraneum]|uniref:Uncharacterized protein n=1 Tax=Trifolium subterraneum TaxID=3900 RepID=A0A2Z6NTU6_TRISU|nr:hypothetical protein TSUD_119100 [Trifolium subterraneum]
MRAFTIIYQPFALIATLILAHYESKINTGLRNLCGYTLFFALSLLAVVLDQTTSGKGGIGTFIGLCAIFACFRITHAFVQGGVTGELSFMCSEFIQAFIGGVTASGVVACGLRLFTKYYFEKSDNGLRKGAYTGVHELGTWYPLVLMTVYNITDMVSSYIPLIKVLKLESRKGLTNGYLTVCVYTVVPKGYKGPEQNALGNLLALCLLSGVFAGVALSWLWQIGKSEST